MCLIIFEHALGWKLGSSHQTHSITLLWYSFHTYVISGCVIYELISDLSQGSTPQSIDKLSRLRLIQLNTRIVCISYFYHKSLELSIKCELFVLGVSVFYILLICIRFCDSLHFLDLNFYLYSFFLFPDGMVHVRDTIKL